MNRFFHTLSACGLAGLAGCSSASPHTDVVLDPATQDAGLLQDANAAGDAASVGIPNALVDAAGPPQVIVVDAGSADAATGGKGCGDGTRDDVDGDGFLARDGDCNDCLKTVNPAAIDVPGNGIDEDCSGSADQPVNACDERLAIDSSDAKDAARAIGLCSFPAAESRAWGVLSARFTNASGTADIHDPHAAGLLTTFGAAKPRDGATLLALSTGVARAPGQPNYGGGCADDLDTDCDFFGCKDGSSAPPPGYPKPSTTCGDNLDAPMRAYDQAALELKLRVPSNANGLSFESMFYTHEFPDYICSPFNDFFVVFKEPVTAPSTDSNILFDKNHDPIGVNSALFAVCDATAKTGKAFACEQGTALLRGTGFGAREETCDLSSTKYGGGATGWLKTTAPVEPGSVITLRFAIWDTADPILNSTALLDHFSWTTFEGVPEKQVDTRTEHVPLL